MNGPEHYREAERLLLEPGWIAEVIAAAQVHATLAQVAATIEATATADSTVSSWVEALA